jgi:alpha-aminoadipic semialdehyde synthase
MVTASYLSPQMRDLHKSASEAGITIVNEVGVDPGIDHMLAMQVFDEIKEAGGVIKSCMMRHNDIVKLLFSHSNNK